MMPSINRIVYISVIITFFVFINSIFAQETKNVEETISLDFKGMDVVDVLKLLAQRGNMNIAISKNVRGKVTMFLKDVNIYDAFEIILVSNDLAYEKKGDIINVMTERDYERRYGHKFHDKRILEIFELKHANVADVSKAITQIKTKIGKVIVDEGTNAIVVMDSPQIIAEARNIIKTLDKPIETRVFTLDYAKAEDVKAKIEEKLTKNIGTVQVDERTNKLIITELRNKMPAIEEIVYELDEKTREVLIEAKILEITLNEEFKWGINWDKAFKIMSNMAAVGVGANFADVFASNILPAETGSAIGSALEIGTLDQHRYHALLEVLETMGRTEVLSSPRIVVINNEEASILVGTNQPYATTGTTVSETVSQTTQQVTYVDLGVKLHVTPTINRNGFITIKIKPEVSSKTDDYTIVSEEGTTTRTTTVPVISTSEAETTVMVKDGNTIVLAGLIEKRHEQEENKIPYLGDIPLIGGLFKSKRKGSTENPERKELVIFLTPHIISGEIQSPEVGDYLTTTEVGKAEIIKPEGKLKLTHFKTAEGREVTIDRMESIDDRIKRFSKKTKDYKDYKDKIILAIKETEDTSELSPEAYYTLVRNKVLEVARDNYPRSNISGDVYLSFVLSSDGRLVGSPKVLAPVDDSLKMLAIKSVKRASPFPPFPQSIPGPVEKFKIVISYK